MKKMKKFFAMFLTLAMVLGMSITTFAAETATITVLNAGDSATLTMKQIIAPNTETETGWEFVNNAGTYYKTAFALQDEQAIIWKLIKLAEPNAANIPENTEAATTTEIQNALKLIETNISYDTFTNRSTVSNAGVYAIKAVEDGFSYSPMAAYVAFGSYNTTTGVPGILVDAEVEAKRVPLSVEKTSDEEDDVVFVGDIVNYTISTTVPYIAENVTSVTYEITDTITGAEYVTTELGDQKVVTLNVKVGEAEAREYTAVVSNGTTAGSQTFTVDLKDIASNRDNANAALVITYQATVTGTVVNNSAIPNDGEHTFTPVTDTLYTGSLTMTKTGENNEPLANAEFVIYTTRNEQTVYAVVENGNVTGWVTTEENASHVITDNNGTVTVKGFDDSETYSFKEVVAPAGYSINTTDSVAVWGTGQTADDRTGTATMTDTQLNSLPSTGGIGTTIFTVGGCVIMIIAAGLYFSLRRKTVK